jgi:hypothetical protein
MSTFMINCVIASLGGVKCNKRNVKMYRPKEYNVMMKNLQAAMRPVNGKEVSSSIPVFQKKSNQIMNRVLVNWHWYRASLDV